MDRADITGLVLAGGRGSRMGGVDKGLQTWRGKPLVQWMIERLQPQVGTLLVNANRHVDVYAGFGLPVVTDENDAFAGPLAGMLSGMARCDTPFLATTPCDVPSFPADMVQRLGAAMDTPGIDIAIAAVATPEGPRLQPVFALMRVGLRASLRAYVDRGETKVRSWMTQQSCVEVLFQDASAFENFNTGADLQRP